MYFPEKRAVYIAHTFGIISHSVDSMLAIIIGPFQFLPKFRKGKFLAFHRWLGVFQAAGLELITSYMIVAWLMRTSKLFVAEWMVKQQRLLNPSF